MIEGTLSSYGGSTRQAIDSRRTWEFLNQRGKLNVRYGRGKVILNIQEEAMSFKLWMKKVDVFVEMLAGCSVYDLPDCLFRDWYEDGVTPEEAAARAVEEVV